MIDAQTRDRQARAAWSVLAGIGAGMVAALATAAAELAMGVHIPPVKESALSAFFAALAGGLLYAALFETVRRPVTALWIASLGIATVDSLLVALLPMPAGRGFDIGIPIDGLIVPLRQLAALVGLGHFGSRHFPATLLPADTVLHYIPALTVALLVPYLVGRFRGAPAAA